MAGDDFLTALSMDNNCSRTTVLSMDPSGTNAAAATSYLHDDTEVGSSSGAGEQVLHVQPRHPHRSLVQFTAPPDINLPFSSDLQLLPWSGADPCDVQLLYHDADAMLNLPKVASSNGHCIGAAGLNRKSVKRSDSIWGAWFFFSFYFKPLLADKSKAKVVGDSNNSLSGFDKSDLRTDEFLVQHDMENMYMWVFKDRPDSALGKMQLRSYMNGHSRPGEPQFPFSVDRGFIRSHRMQRKQYRGLSNPQCIHGIEVVRSPNLSSVSEADRKRWTELTGRDLSFVIPLEASDYVVWRNAPNPDLELERPAAMMAIPKAGNSHAHPKKLLNGSGLNLSSLSSHSSEDGMDLSPVHSKRKKDVFPHAVDEECFIQFNAHPERPHDVEMLPAEPLWANEFTGVMREACGPVTAAKTIYEDEEGYLIMVSLPFADHQRVKVSWRNSRTNGILKIIGISTARKPLVRRHDRVFRLTDPSPEHCPPGEFTREIPLATRIPEDAKLEAYFDEAGSVLEIVVPKHPSGPEEHEVRVCMRPPHLDGNDLALT